MYNKYIDEIINTHEIYAHKKSDSKESLLDHMELTLEYYDELNKAKNSEKIIKKIISNLYSNIKEEMVEEIYSLFKAAIYYHDIGKVNPNFQNVKMENKHIAIGTMIGSSHSILSAKIYIDCFEKYIREEMLKKYKIEEVRPLFLIVNTFGFIISRHHSKIEGINDFITKLSALDVEKLDLGLKNSHSEEQGNIFSNNTRNQIYKDCEFDEINIYILAKLLFSFLVSADYYATCEFMSGEKVKIPDTKQKELFNNYENSELYKSIKNNNNIDKYDINSLRTEIFKETEQSIKENLDKNIFYLEAPTGSGKTNTSLNLARYLYKNCDEISSINYIFPFNTLITQTVSVFDKYFKNNSDFVVINSVYPIVESENENINYEDMYIKNIFRHYPITITSHINLFESLFGIGKQANFSLIDYINSVVIIDEIQSYSNEIWREIILMIQKFAINLNIKFIIMSATLPKLDLLEKDEDVQYCKLLKDSSKYYNNKLFKERVKLDFSLLKQDITLEELKKEVMKYKDKKVLIEFIKKEDARDFYNMMKETEIEVYELTGDDNTYYRGKVINKINDRKKICIVATQTIEAGVDIDMDIGFKDISLLDSEEQFLGRINRSCKKENSKAIFFNYTEAKNIYRNDKRVQFDIRKEEYQKNLEDKNFDEYYKKVLESLKKATSKSNDKNIEGFRKECLSLEYEKVEDKLRLIKNNSSQVFLNYNFQKNDRLIKGKEIWEKYKNINKDKELSYPQKQIKLSQIKEDMSLFMYNIQITKNKTVFFDEEFAGIYYIEKGSEFIEDDKFNRKKYDESIGGYFI